MITAQYQIKRELAAMQIAKIPWPMIFSRFEKMMDEFRKNRNRYANTYRCKNLDKCRLKMRESYARHKERRQADAKFQRQKIKQNPERLAKLRQWCCDNVRKKKATNVQFRIRFLTRNRIWMSLQRGVAKAGTTVELVGCSMADFKKHIESLWLPGMSWDNYGRGADKWHMDHKIPCVAFDLTDPEQQKKCFHYSNVQPLWELDNLKKGANW